MYSEFEVEYKEEAAMSIPGENQNFCIITLIMANPPWPTNRVYWYISERKMEDQILDKMV